MMPHKFVFLFPEYLFSSSKLHTYLKSQYSLYCVWVQLEPPQLWYFTNILTMFCVLAKHDCGTLLIHFTVEPGKYR